MKPAGNTASYEVIAERAPIGLLVLDETGTIRWTNEEYAALLGVPRDTLVGTAFPALVDAGYYEDVVVDQWNEAVRTLLSDANDVERENYHVRTHLSNQVLVHDVSTALLPLDEGEFRGTVHAFRDVTAQKEYERELKRQNDRLNEFASVVSHDLRNPLTVAQGYLDRARETDDEAAFEKVERAHREMETLIDDLLSLARSGEQVQETSEVEIVDVARSAWASVETDGATLDLAADLGTVTADRTRLQQLFENLFRNSVEHGPCERADTESLTVRVGPLDDQQGFFVADDGTGIPEAERDKVFDRGYTTEDAGTGLGLAIVNTIVDAHGWTIELGDGDGTRFEVATTERVPL